MLHLCPHHPMRVSKASQPFASVYDRHVGPHYRALLGWLRLMRRAVQYGIDTQLIGGGDPVLTGMELVAPWHPSTKLAKRSVELFAEQLAEKLKTEITKAGFTDVTATLADWNCIRNRGANAIGPIDLRIYGKAHGVAGQLARVRGTWDVVNTRAVEWAARNSNALVTSIVEEQRATLRRLVSEGIKEGKAIPTIARDIRDVVGLNDRQVVALSNFRESLTAKFAGMEGGLTPAREAKVNMLAARESEKKLAYRSEMIARTETAGAVSAGTIETYRASEVDKVQFLASADACEICADLDGKIYTLLESEGVIPGQTHPCCRCSWIPVVGEEAPAAEEQPVEERSGRPEQLNEIVQEPTYAEPAGAGVPYVPMPPVAPPVTIIPAGGVPAGEAIPIKPGSVFSSGKIESTQNLGGGVNKSMKVHIGGDGDGVYKPKSGEMAGLRRSIKDGTMYKRERAAYLVDQRLGFDLVPETVIRGGKDGVGSVQAWVNNTESGGDSGTMIRFGASRKEVSDNLVKLNIFDVLTANTDRHPGNYLIITEGKRKGGIVAIDNGCCFASNKSMKKGFDLPRLAFNVEGDIPVDQLAKLESFLGRRSIITKDLKGLLTKDEIDSMFVRAKWIISKKNNLDGLDRYAFEREILDKLK